MRIGFRERPYDLILLAGLVLVLTPLAIAGVGGLLGLAAGVLVVVCLPGYAALAALFPADGDLGWVQRVAFSLGLSLALVPLAGLISSATPWGIRIEIILAILALVALGSAAVAYRRRLALPAVRRLGLSIEVVSWRLRGLSRLERILILGLAAALAIASVGIVYSASRSQITPGFTEFYLLNETGVPGGYPTSLRIGQNATIRVVIVNHESISIDYTVEVRLAGLDNGTELWNATQTSFGVLLGDGSSRDTPYVFHIDQAGDYAIEFLLSRGSAGAYRFLRLLITVT